MGEAIFHHGGSAELLRRAMHHDQAAELLREDAERHDGEAIRLREEAFNLWKRSQKERHQ